MGDEIQHSRYAHPDDEEDQGEGGEHAHHREPEILGRTLSARGQKGNGQQEGHDGEVLEDQDRDSEASVGRVDLGLIRE